MAPEVSIHDQMSDELFDVRVEVAEAKWRNESGLVASLFLKKTFGDSCVTLQITNQ